MGILSSERFSPTIFVGLGGSGSKVVNLIAAKLKHHPNWDRFRNLIHFVCIDTNKEDLDKQTYVPNRFLISAFDRRAYIDRKRGRGELDVDPMVTQWVHPNYEFRDARGVGAGQIRVESRVGLYFNLEADRAGIVAALNRMLNESTGPANPYLSNEHADRVVNVLVYGSVAGGTGSGGFLPMAYLLQQIVDTHGWGRPNVVGTVLLPALFKNDVEPRLHADIDANSYAALKELEHLTKLSYEGYLDEVEFHYNPMSTDHKFVSRRPFSICYLVDKPGELSLPKYLNAVADSAFVQIFSPIVGTQAGEYDNYDKHQKSLAQGHFAVHYGSFGAALLVLPRRELLHYAMLRWVHRVFETYLVAGKGEEIPEGIRVDFDDPKFQRLSRDEQARKIDDAFTYTIDAWARNEEKQQEKGVYSKIRSDLPALQQGFYRRLSTLFGGLDDQITVEPLDEAQIHEENTSLARARENLRTDIKKSRSRVMGSYLSGALGELRSGRFFDEFFDANKVEPLAQRYFLIALKNRGKLTPFENDQGDYLHNPKPDAFDLDDEHVQRELDSKENSLRTTSQRGALSSLLSRENKAFAAAKRAVKEHFTDLEDANREWLKISFWQSYHEELQVALEVRLTAFRNVAQISSESAKNLLAEAERLRADPTSHSSAMAASSFYLDAEVLRHDKARDRLWNVFFEHKLNRDAYYDTSLIFKTITESFKPTRDREGKLRAKDANQVVRSARSALEELGRAKMEEVLEELKFDLRSALELEARYIATGGSRRDEQLEAVPAQQVAAHCRQKFQDLKNECVLLAQIDPTKKDDPTVVPAEIFYVGLDPRYASDESGSLREYITQTADKAQFIPGWSERDLVVFYRACLGIPLYFYQRVNNELRHNYLKVMNNPKRSYPLHIEAAWENTLPNIDPIEVKAADEKRRAEQAATTRRAEVEERVWQFVVATVSGGVQKGENGGWDWVSGPARKELARTRALAFDAFWVLDADLRERLVRSGKQVIADRVSTPPERRKFREELRGYLKLVSDQYDLAVANEDETSRKYLKEEMRVVEQRIDELGT